MLQFVDPNVLFGDEESSVTLLHNLADLTDPSEYSTQVNQLIQAQQLVEHGANVNAVTSPNGAETPLQYACYTGSVTNLDFIELLLKEGADPNSQNHVGLTPLMMTTVFAPGAAKFLLNWPTTDANITDRSGVSILAFAHRTLMRLSDKIAHSDSPEQVQHKFLLQQWIEIEKMLVERRAVDTGFPTLE